MCALVFIQNTSSQLCFRLLSSWSKKKKKIELLSKNMAIRPPLKILPVTKTPTQVPVINGRKWGRQDTKESRAGRWHGTTLIQTQMIMEQKEASSLHFVEIGKLEYIHSTYIRTTLAADKFSTHSTLKNLSVQFNRLCQRDICSFTYFTQRQASSKQHNHKHQFCFLSFQSKVIRVTFIFMLG